MRLFGTCALAAVGLTALLQGAHYYGQIVGPANTSNVMMRAGGEQVHEYQAQKGWSQGLTGQISEPAPEIKSAVVSTSEPAASGALQAEQVQVMGSPVTEQSLATNAQQSLQPSAAQTAVSPWKPADVQRRSIEHMQAISVAALGYTGIERFYKWRDPEGDLQYSVSAPTDATHEKIIIRPGENIMKSLPQHEIDRLLGDLIGGGKTLLPSWLAEVLSVPVLADRECITHQLRNKAAEGNVCVSKAALHAAIQRMTSVSAS